MTEVRFRNQVPGTGGTSEGPTTGGRPQNPQTLTPLARDRFTPAVRDNTYVRAPLQAALPGAFDRKPLPLIKPGETRFITAKGTVITDTSLSGYAPETTTARTLPSDKALATYLTSTERLFPLNRERTDLAALRGELTGWARRNPSKVASAIGGSSAMTAAQAESALANLTPAQAARLTTIFAADNITFLEGAPAGPAKHCDSIGVHTLVAGGRGTGVCRNYAETVSTTFSVLKDMQRQPSRLVNTYAQQISGWGHRWNAFYTVQPDRSVVATMTDGVWADSGTLEVNTKGRVYAMQSWLMNQMSDHQSALVDRAMKGDESFGFAALGDGTLTADEVRNQGGMSVLAQRYRGLWLPQQQTFLKKLAPDVRRELLAYLQRAGEPAPFVANPAQSDILY